ncbi:MAG: DUF2470 domain-containing protein [Pseudomonadota bacterium]
MDEPKNVLRETDKEAIALARTLLLEARSGALASLEASSGHPLASRVSLSNDSDGAPLILVSELSDHTPALRADPRASLLVGREGKGDPLAHARMTVYCRAEQLDPKGPDHLRARRRFLARHPKAELYVDFGDFYFFRLNVEKASLNGGFGKAYHLTQENLLGLAHPSLSAFDEMESAVVAHMNEDHADAVTDYARAFGKRKGSDWKMAGLDPRGIDLTLGDETLRIDFERDLESPDEIRPMLIVMAKRARAEHDPS